MLAGGVVAGPVPGAHADVCDLGVGHLASFGLRCGEGPGAKLDAA